MKLKELLLKRRILTGLLKRYFSEDATNIAEDQPKAFKEDMNAWTIPSFGNLDKLTLLNSVPSPILSHHKDVIVRVLATSVNPLDVAMVEGYGQVLLSVMRNCDNFVNKSETPGSCLLIPGRDFAGQVVAKGSGVRDDIKVGKHVYGVIPAHLQGCHAEMVSVSDKMVRPVPKGRPLVEAAALLYTGMTAWSALCITGDLIWSSREGKKVLIIGAAGGIGSLAVQMLKAWKAQVVATCKTDAVPLVQTLGADKVIDYTSPDALRQIESNGKYDIILDAAGTVTHYTYIPFLKDWSNSKYVTLRSPLLKNTDQLGIVGGMIKNATELVRSNIVSGAPKKGATIRWAYFIPLESGVDELHSLYTSEKIAPVVTKLFAFKDLPSAYKTVREGHNRGKVVLTMSNLESEASLLEKKII